MSLLHMQVKENHWTASDRSSWTPESPERVTNCCLVVVV